MAITRELGINTMRIPVMNPNYTVICTLEWREPPYNELTYPEVIQLNGMMFVLRRDHTGEPMYYRQI